MAELSAPVLKAISGVAEEIAIAIVPQNDQRRGDISLRISAMLKPLAVALLDQASDSKAPESHGFVRSPSIDELRQRLPSIQ